MKSNLIAYLVTLFGIIAMGFETAFIQDDLTFVVVLMVTVIVCITLVWHLLDDKQ